MKKRILALALAGTTAFSVFGAALSANAAAPTGYPVDSAHVYSTNDVYKRYEAPNVAKAIYVQTTADTSVTNSLGYDGLKNQNFQIGDGTNGTYTDKYQYIYQMYNVQEEYVAEPVTMVTVNEPAYEPKTGVTGGIIGKTEYDALTDAQKENYLPTTDQSYAVHTIKFVEKAGKDGQVNVKIDDGNVTKYKPSVVTVNGAQVTGYYVDGNVYTTVAELINGILAGADVGITNYQTTAVENTNQYVHSDKYVTTAGDSTASFITQEEYDALKKADELNIIVNSNTTTTPGTAPVIKVNNSTNWTDWTWNASTSADTTIYPWTTTTKYIDYNGNAVVNEAVSVPTIYAFDFIPYNTTSSVSSIGGAWNAKKAVETGNAFNGTNKTATSDWTAEKGYGGSYGIRAEVISDYEDFLSELVLLQRYGDYVVSKTDFKDEYKDEFVSGYYYDPYTGAATSAKWTADLYNISMLLDDIYDSSVNNAYSQMNTSELMYLMQQYDKYIGYIQKAEVSKDAWGDLLVSILENVTEDDFKKSTDYKQFNRKAEDLIDAYNDAETSSMIKTAEAEMYKLIVSEQSKTAGATDEKKELKSDLYNLYFNAKSTVNGTDYGYTTQYAYHGNAVLNNYAYLQAVTLYKGDYTTIGGTVLTSTTKTAPGYYTLYPQVDYAESGNAVERYVGNTSANYDGDATDKYEWFLNVYELANKVNSTSKALSGVVTAVDEALNDAVADLEVTKNAYATASSALDEMIENYEEVLDFYVEGNGVNEDDFNATYYAAYEEALAYAEIAEGAAQVANARYMVEVAAEALTYQGAQVTVTKNDITSLNNSIKDGQEALKAIKDSKDYNAAQVTALNKAIAQAEEIVSIYNGKTAGYNKVNHVGVSLVGDKDAIVKSDITGAIDAINAAIDYSEVVMGWSKNDAGKWMYGTDEGYLNNGWNKIASVWYYFNEDGTAKQSEWMQEDGKWYWFNSNAGAAIGWAKVDNQWYYFGGNNAMKTGWQKVDGNWYYLASSGRMVTGWAQVDGKWYYMSKESNSLGQMLANTTTPDGYKVGADGAML